MITSPSVSGFAISPKKSRVGKTITFSVDAETAASARTIAREMAERLLSNPVIEEFWLFDAETME